MKAEFEKPIRAAQRGMKTHHLVCFMDNFSIFARRVNYRGSVKGSMIEDLVRYVACGEGYGVTDGGGSTSEQRRRLTLVLEELTKSRKESELADARRVQRRKEREQQRLDAALARQERQAEALETLEKLLRGTPMEDRIALIRVDSDTCTLSHGLLQELAEEYRVNTWGKTG